MNLTEKDKDFLEKLTRLIEEKDLAVELQEQPFRRFVLRKNYGDKVHRSFRMTRQGVRWRFQRVFNGVYVSALETLLTVERAFGPTLRNGAIRIAQERYLLRKQAPITDPIHEHDGKHES